MNTHQQEVIPFENLGDNLDFILRLQEAHKNDGQPAVSKFLRETEKKQRLPAHSLDHFMPLIMPLTGIRVIK